jgi:hypothetical protein
VAGLEPRERRVASGDAVDQVRELGGEPAQHLAERKVRQRALAEVEAVAGEHPPSLALGQVAQLHQQPGLADPGVPAEQDGAGPVALRTDTEQVAELPKLGIASDQGPARVGCHGHHHGARHRQRAADFRAQLTDLSAAAIRRAHAERERPERLAANCLRILVRR